MHMNTLLIIKLNIKEMELNIKFSNMKWYDL